MMEKNEMRLNTVFNSVILYDFISSDMPDEKIKMFAAMKFVMEYKLDGDTWTYDVSMPNGHNVKTFQFKLGESFDSTTFDGRPIKVCRGLNCSFSLSSIVNISNCSF